jgi:membrane protease subunit (stomatin/prohibitin family)
MTNFIDIIKSTSSNEAIDFIIHKFPEEDFNTNSQLIVAESEEALFVNDGIVLNVFGPGRYTLSTQNFPFISALLSKFSGEVRPFQSKVFFVNREHKLENLWGTDSPIQLRDPVLRIQTSLQARGSFSLQVIDSKKLLVKLSGSNIVSFSRSDLTNYFKSAFLQTVKDSIAHYILDSQREILEICASREIVASSCSEKLSATLEEYGLKLVNFYITAMDIPANDPNRQKLEEAFASKAVMGILGNDWARQQSVDILKDLANNEGSGLAALGASAGLGIAMASPIASMANNLGKLDADVPGDKQKCSSCSAVLDGKDKFCSTCGTKQADK